MGGLRRWFTNYDHLQCCSVWMLYLQIACATAGSLSPVYSGVSVANLAVALFALVAIESGSQTLGRTYAGLLIAVLLADIAWFVLFTDNIWYILLSESPHIRIRLLLLGRHIIKDSTAGVYLKLSVATVFWTEITGFVARIFSAFLWLHLYRLGASPDIANSYEPVDLRGISTGIGTVGFATPLASPAPSRQTSMTDEAVGGSIYDPAYYTSLFQPAGRLSEIEEQLTEQLAGRTARVLFS